MITFINFKNYSSGLGARQTELLDFLETLGSSPNYPDFPAHPDLHLVVPVSELSPIWQKYSFPLWAEHCDPVKTYKATGWISAEQIKEAGAIGTMLNHSEHRLPFSVIKETTEICHEHGLQVLICCENEKEAILFSSLNPEYLAYEPPELIALKTKSVISKEKEIKQLASLLSNSPTNYVLPARHASQGDAGGRTTYSPILLVGAGIHSKEDIKKAEDFGASGILLSSAIMEGNNEDIKKLLTIN